MTALGRALALEKAGRRAWWFWLRLHYNGINQCTRVQCISKRTFLTFHLLFSCSKGSETWCMVSFCMIANEEGLWHDIMLQKSPRVSVGTIALGSNWTVWPTLWSADCQGCVPHYHSSLYTCMWCAWFSFLWDGFDVYWKWRWTFVQSFGFKSQFITYLLVWTNPSNSWNALVCPFALWEWF